MKNRHRRKRGFRFGWVNRQRTLWGAIGFVVGAAVMFLVTSDGIDSSSMMGSLTEGASAKCRHGETGAVLNNVSDANGKVWPVVKYELQIAGTAYADAVRESVCSLPGGSVPIGNDLSRHYINTETGDKVFATYHFPVNSSSVVVLRFHNWR